MTLPIYQTLNHWFFGVFIVLSLLAVAVDNNLLERIVQYKWHIAVIGTLLLIKVFGLITAESLNHATKEITRALPFLLYPLAVLSLKSKQKSFKELESQTFYALTIGCIISALICWTNAIVNFEPGSEPMNMLFGWKKSGSYLTAILDIHPPYLGMLIAASMLFLGKELFYNPHINGWIRGLYLPLLLFLGLFLFNITARNAMFFVLFTAFAFLVYTRRWKLLLIPVVLMIVANVLIVNHPSQYYRIKMYDMLGIGEDRFQDLRFKRLKASYNVFKMSPVFGVGMGNDTSLKIKEYDIMGDDIAVQKRLNSHNQFFEYLAAFGLIGAVTFLFVFGYMLQLIIRHKYYFYLLLFTGVILASLTESIFERALGIQYFSIICGLVLLKHYDDTK